MQNPRSATGTKLRLEELETRALLAAVGISPDVTPVNPDGSSDLHGDGFPGQMSLVAAAAMNSGFAAPGFTTVPGSGVVLVDQVESAPAVPLVQSGPDAASGVGQMTLTTGANTPGLGSFATSVSGFASEFGGRS